MNRNRQTQDARSIHGTARLALMSEMRTLETDVLVVGAGPAGSSAAAWLARQGRSVMLADAEVFPRDKACGDGLTPRAIAEQIGRAHA